LVKKDEQLAALTNNHGAIKERRRKVEEADEITNYIQDELRT
jgi:hypothetical protein